MIRKVRYWPAFVIAGVSALAMVALAILLASRAAHG